MGKLGMAVASMACVLLLLGVALIPSPGYDIELQADVHGNTASVTVRISGNDHANTLSLVGASLNEVRNDTMIIVSDDDNRTMLGEATSMFDHMQAEAQLRGVALDLKMAQIDELPALFYGENAIIVMFGHDGEMGEAAQQWVERGGVLVGFGPHSIPFVGENMIMDLDFSPYEFSEDDIESSSVADALALDTVAPRVGMGTDSVLENGGEPIGYSCLGMESLALFPMGEGRLLMFSAHPSTPILTSGADSMASDLFRLVMSGMIWKNGEIQHITIQYVPGGGVWQFEMSRVADMRITAISLEKWETLFAAVDLN